MLPHLAEATGAVVDALSFLMVKDDGDTIAVRQTGKASKPNLIIVQHYNKAALELVENTICAVALLLVSLVS